MPNVHPRPSSVYRRPRAVVHHELSEFLAIRAGVARFGVLLQLARLSAEAQPECHGLAQSIQVRLTALEIGAPCGLRARVAVERDRFDALYLEACRMALDAPAQLAEVIDLRAARADRANLTALRALHARMDAAALVAANDAQVAS